MQVSWLGDAREDLKMPIYADADFAGDPRTQRSTSGVVLAVVGPYTRCMLSAASHTQTCVSHSTPEAEIVAADLALRTEAIPARPLWEKLLDRSVDVEFMEDNEAVVKICRSGNSQKLMHLPRTHRVDASFIAECTQELNICKIGHAHTDNQAADICTKRFTDPPKWLKLLYLINVVSDRFWTADTFSRLINDFCVKDHCPNRPGGRFHPSIGTEDQKLNVVNKR